MKDYIKEVIKTEGKDVEGIKKRLCEYKGSKKIINEYF